jgi:hypothetical protein
MGYILPKEWSLHQTQGDSKRLLGLELTLQSAAREAQEGTGTAPIQPSTSPSLQ